MAIEDLKIQLKKAVSKNLAKGLDEIDTVLRMNSQIYDDYLHLFGRFSRLNRNIQKDVINEREASQEFSRLTSTALDLIEGLIEDHIKIAALKDSSRKKHLGKRNFQLKNIVSDSKIKVKGDFHVGDRRVIEGD